MTFFDWYSVVMVTLGVFFFIAGGVGLWRFPDELSRLHALTKADNLGLGFVVLGVLPQVVEVADAIQLLLIWVAVMLAGAVSCYLLASHTGLDQGEHPVEHRGRLEEQEAVHDKR
ncbi:MULTISPECIES: monovalent cation/H(+) antiporter subunit G [unclassified Pseudoalteromonas]|uniref:monovalent cation/H(+) antiporter subunit G n=1 Tax=unclassified Pseudoalteromonas TaxID=194690 RepID=UPI002098036B|nr:monovalent cation/H(+) antiporter subunit G [Pseudoalteromonas sp. XMcav2-N]MCO7187991.1 monovalent cation/H(+) antiporter subunit G [Pseudoalteromonas sp. XMcav2-N]